MHKRLVLVALAATAGVVGIAASAGSASAESTTPLTGYVKQYATSFTGPSETAIPVHHLKPGMTVDAYCFRNGQPLGGQAAWITINHDGETAYLHSESLSVPDLPHC